MIDIGAYQKAMQLSEEYLNWFPDPNSGYTTVSLIARV